MITLYQFYRSDTVPNLSPFCLKLETYLKMSQLEYKVHFTNMVNKAPKKKLPYITDDEVVLADSSFIIDYLETKYKLKLDSHLTNEQKSTGLFIQRTLEDHLIWPMVYFRWVDQETWPAFKQVVFGKMPAPLRAIVPRMLQKNVKKKCAENGVAAHSRNDILELARKDLEALSIFLGEKKYLFNDLESSFDAVLFAFMANIYFSPIKENPLLDIAKSYPNLREHAERVMYKYYQK